MRNEVAWTELRNLIADTQHKSIAFSPRFAPYYVNEKEGIDTEVVSVNLDFLNDEIFFTTNGDGNVYESFPFGDVDGDSILIRDEDVTMLIDAIKKQERGYAKIIALAVKNRLTHLATNDELPLDINELDVEELIDPIVTALQTIK